jgi:WD40 repeat protein
MYVEPPLSVLDEEHWFNGLACTPEGRMLLASRLENRGLFSRRRWVILHLHLAPAKHGWQVDTTLRRSETNNGAALIDNTCLVLSGSWGLRLCPLDLEATAPLRVPDLTRALAVATSQRGEFVASSSEGKLRVWNLRNPNPVAVWAAPSETVSTTVSALAFSPDGRTLVAGDTNRTVGFYDPFTGQCRAEYNFGIGAIHSLAFAPDGFTLAVAGRTGLVVVDAE